MTPFVDDWRRRKSAAFDSGFALFVAEKWTGQQSFQTVVLRERTDLEGPWPTIFFAHCSSSWKYFVPA